jgi:hypothetical protein
LTEEAGGPGAGFQQEGQTGKGRLEGSEAILKLEQRKRWFQFKFKWGRNKVIHPLSLGVGNFLASRLLYCHNAEISLSTSMALAGSASRSRETS